MADNNNISIILVTYFTTDVLFDCIESCRKMNGIREIIVVNNGNPPHVLAKLKTLNDNREIRLLDGHGNLGFARSCNLGALHSKGEYLLFINPDCYTSDSEFAIKLRNAIEKNPQYWFATSLILNSDGTIQKTCRRRLMTPINAISQSLGLKKFGFPEMNCEVGEIAGLPDVSELEAFSGALIFCPKTYFEQVGGFSEDYFLHVEDMDLCKKIQLAGGKICFVKTASIHHKLSTSQVTSEFLEWHKARGFIHYLQKFFPCCNLPVIRYLLKAAIWARYYIKIYFK